MKRTMNESPVKYIKRNRLDGNNTKKTLTIVTADGKAYKRRWYRANRLNQFTYNQGWYSLEWNSLDYGINVRYLGPNRVADSEVIKIQMMDGHENPFGELPESTDISAVDDSNEPDDTLEFEQEFFAPIAEEVPVQEEVPQIDWSKSVKHHEYDTIKSCIECGLPVYLAGPAGSGKNHTLEQIANELGMNFYFSNSVQQEYKLTGFIDAGGTYHETEFYKAAMDENECIFFLDEMDASIPEVLVLLNAAIANGYFEFPTGKVELNHIHFVAAGNTVGSGADDKYTGRMVIDQATLDRFVIVEFDYDEMIELHLCKGDYELVRFIRDLRERTDKAGIRATFSYRCITAVYKLVKTNMALEKVIKIAVMKGLDKDTINTIRLDGTTKYHEALRNIQRAA